MHLLIPREAFAELTYANEDLATVRVAAVKGVQSVEVVPTEGSEKKGPFTIGVPVAGHGSGVLVSNDGLIVTAAHVIEDAEFVAVKVPGRSDALMAQVLYENEYHDIAYLKVSGSFEHFITIAETPPTLQVRQRVFALGYPLDGTRTYPQSTGGVVSGTLKNGELQLGISVNPGNSGGPLIDESGQLIGIVVRTSDSSKGVQGLGYAVPFDVVKKYMDRRAKRSPLLKRSAPSAARLKQDAAAAEVIARLATVGTFGAVREYIEHEGEDLRNALRVSLKAYKDNPDFMALTSSHYWNTAIVRYVLKGDGSEESRRRAEILARQAISGDRTVLDRSPFLYHVLGIQRPQSSSAEVAVPRKIGGFALGWTVEKARDACTIDELQFTQTDRGYQCARVPSSKSITGPVRLRFCGDRLCRIEIIHRPSKELSSVWSSELTRLRSYLTKRYGKYKKADHVVPRECRDKILPCLEEGKAIMKYAWEFEGPQMQLRMGRLAGKPAIEILVDEKP